MFKEFFVKRQLKGMGVNDEQLDAMMKVVKSNPGLFQRLGQEIEEKVSKNKMSYEDATLMVTQKYQKDLAQIFGKNK